MMHSDCRCLTMIHNGIELVFLSDADLHRYQSGSKLSTAHIIWDQARQTSGGHKPSWDDAVYCCRALTFSFNVELFTTSCIIHFIVIFSSLRISLQTSLTLRHHAELRLYLMPCHHFCSFLSFCCQVLRWFHTYYWPA